MNKVKLKLFIEKLEDFLEKYPNETVNMVETSYDGCGSPACHGGWMHAIIDEKYERPKKRLSFGIGSDLLGDFLGFNGRKELESWANDNPEIWGNKDGRFMFACESAFNEKNLYYNDNFNLKVILDKWKAVYERL